MSIIKRLSIKNYVGIEEREIDPGKITIISGAKGVGKSSIIEAIKKIFTNENVRTETIRHGESESFLFAELDNSLQITRKERTDKADYFNVKKEGEGVPSTEKFVRSLFNGEIFNPIAWVNKGEKEQTKSILNTLQIEWSKENIEKWFGEIPSNIEYSQHILMVLKAIENKYFTDRSEINTEIKHLLTQIEVIKKDLPENYNGETWREKKVQEYYQKVSDAKDINNKILENKNLQEGIQERIDTIGANIENEKSRVKLKYRELRNDINDIIDLSKNKIEKSKETLNNLDVTYQHGLKTITLDNEKAVSDLDKELVQKIEELRTEYTGRISLVNEKSATDKDILKTNLENTKRAEDESVILQEKKIATKEQELISLDEIELKALESVEAKKVSEVEIEQLKAGQATDFLKNAIAVEVLPLQQEADEVAAMQTYLRQWDNLIDIRDNKLSEKERQSSTLTAKIETARSLPSELLKTAQMPIEGISIDEKGLIRINGTLIDGLSSAEKLDLAFRIARSQAGDLKLICLDGWESIKSESKELLEEMLKDDFQYFILEHTEDKEMQIKKLN